MWIFNRDGFFSAVEDKDNSEVIMVRARVREDLETLIDRLEGLDYAGEDMPKPEILEWAGTDYGYRIFIPRVVWASYLQLSGQELDYTNFKAANTAPGTFRSAAYHDVWSRLRQWQHDGIFGGGGPWETDEDDPDGPWGTDEEYFYGRRLFDLDWSAIEGD